MTDEEPGTPDNPNMIRNPNSFTGNVIKLASGTVLALVITALITPVLTRLYGPSSFGIYALFISITTTVAVIVSMRYELTIVLPKSDQDATHLFGLSLLFVGIVTILSIPVAVFGAAAIENLLQTPGIGIYIWLLPLSVFTTGLLVVFNYWNSRTRRFTSLSLAQVIKAFMTSGVQLAAGLLGFLTGGSLIIGGILGTGLASAMLGVQIWRQDHHLISGINIEGMSRGMKRYKNFPLIETWSSLLNTISTQMPIWLLAIFFSSTIVGYYSLGVMVLHVPFAFIGSSVAQVFLQRAATARHEGSFVLAEIVRGTVIRLVAIGLPIFLVLGLIGQELFVVVFGAQWAVAGFYTQILAIWLLFAFFTTPIGTLFSVLERQKDSLVINVLLVVSRAGALVVGGLSGDPVVAIILFSVVGTLGIAGSFFYIVRKAHVPLLPLARDLRMYMVYCIPIAVVLVAAKWGMDLSPLLLAVVATASVLPYYTQVIRNDRSLREPFRWFFGYLPFVRPK